MARHLTLMLFAVLLTACGDQAATKTTAPATELMPADPQLAALYDQTCRSCHGQGLGGAPRAGDTAAWAARNAKGMDTLLENTLNGFKGMPPLGACGDCTPEEFEQLIAFMAGS